MLNSLTRKGSQQRRQPLPHVAPSESACGPISLHCRQQTIPPARRHTVTEANPLSERALKVTVAESLSRHESSVCIAIGIHLSSHPLHLNTYNSQLAHALFSPLACHITDWAAERPPLRHGAGKRLGTGRRDSLGWARAILPPEALSTPAGRARSGETALVRYIPRTQRRNREREANTPPYALCARGTCECKTVSWTPPEGLRQHQWGRDCGRFLPTQRDAARISRRRARTVGVRCASGCPVTGGAAAPS